MKELSRRSFIKRLAGVVAVAAVAPTVLIPKPKTNPLLSGETGRFDGFRFIETPTVKFRRYNTLPKCTKPLSKGIRPAGYKMTYTKVAPNKLIARSVPIYRKH